MLEPVLAVLVLVVLPAAGWVAAFKLVDVFRGPR